MNAYDNIINQQVTKHIISILNKSGLYIETLNDLDGYFFDRDILLNVTNIDSMKPNIEELKKTFTSTTMTSFHSNAIHKQKWPVLNLVRQVLGIIHYKMVPIRKANGYDCNKKKLYKRFFMIKKEI